MCGRSGSQGPLLSRFYLLPFLLMLVINFPRPQLIDHEHDFEGETEAALSTFAYISR
jgi:hypothetical protein